MKIWANTIVNNEENFIWFALMSVVDCVDKILVWDSGSVDQTVAIIKEIIKTKGEKIDFKEVGKVDKFEFTKMRQQMLQQSDCDWLLILDGDEIWWEESIKKLRNVIEKKGKTIDGVVVPMKVAAGDIYHLQEEKAGKYKLLGREGHLSLKAINRKIPGLHVADPYGEEGYFDGSKREVQTREKIIFLEAPFLHLTHLARSSKKRPFDKSKIELGEKVPAGFKLPEVMYQAFPAAVPSPWKEISASKQIAAKILTPLRKFKRRFL